MPLYEYLCGRGHVLTERKPVGTSTIGCACGKRAKRVYTAPFIGGAEVPFEDTKYFVESAKRKAGWDYDHQMEHVQREKEKAAHG